MSSSSSRGARARWAAAAYLDALLAVLDGSKGAWRRQSRSSVSSSSSQGARALWAAAAYFDELLAVLDVSSRQFDPPPVPPPPPPLPLSSSSGQSAAHFGPSTLCSRIPCQPSVRSRSIAALWGQPARVSHVVGTSARFLNITVHFCGDRLRATCPGL